MNLKLFDEIDDREKREFVADVPDAKTDFRLKLVDGREDMLPI